MDRVKLLLPFGITLLVISCASPQVSVQNATLSVGGELTSSVNKTSEPTAVSTVKEVSRSGNNTVQTSDVRVNPPATAAIPESSPTAKVNQTSEQKGLTETTLKKLAKVVFSTKTPLVRYCKGTLYEFSAPKKNKNGCEITYAKVKSGEEEKLFEIQNCNGTLKVDEVK